MSEQVPLEVFRKLQLTGSRAPTHELVLENLALRQQLSAVNLASFPVFQIGNLAKSGKLRAPYYAHICGVSWSYRGGGY